MFVNVNCIIRSLSAIAYDVIDGCLSARAFWYGYLFSNAKYQAQNRADMNFLYYWTGYSNKEVFSEAENSGPSTLTLMQISENKYHIYK